MSQRQAIRMDDHDVEPYLRSCARAHIATLDKDGAPHVVPVEYVVYDGAVTFWADPGSQKMVNLRRDPRVSVVVDDGTDFADLRGVQIVGDAVIRDDPDTVAGVLELFSDKVPEEWREIARPHLVALAAERVVVTIAPSRVTSWDHSKVPGLRPQDIGR